MFVGFYNELTRFLLRCPNGHAFIVVPTRAPRLPSPNHGKRAISRRRRRPAPSAPKAAAPADRPSQKRTTYPDLDEVFKRAARRQAKNDAPRKRRTRG